MNPHARTASRPLTCVSSPLRRPNSRRRTPPIGCTINWFASQRPLPLVQGSSFPHGPADRQTGRGVSHWISLRDYSREQLCSESRQTHSADRSRGLGVHPSCLIPGPPQGDVYRPSPSIRRLLREIGRLYGASARYTSYQGPSRDFASSRIALRLFGFLLGFSP